MKVKSNHVFISYMPSPEHTYPKRTKNNNHRYRNRFREGLGKVIILNISLLTENEL